MRPASRLQLLVGPGSGEAGVADVVVEAEAVVVDPHRRPVVGDVGEPLAVAGDVLELGLDVGLDPVDVDATVGPFQLARFEDRHRRHVHVGGARFQRQERGVEI
jgi:hypothetical protein